MQRIQRYGTIEKMVELADGTLQVYGFASTETKDDQGEVITADAMKAAVPEYMEWGAVREMHQPIAAGTALEANVEDDGRTRIGVHVVDPVAVQKCLTGVYKGFSVGGAVTKRSPTNKKVIEGFKWIETSLVDRPSNPGAKFVVVKLAGADTPTEDSAMETSTTEPGATPATEPAADAPATPADAAPSATTTETPAPDSVRKGMWTIKSMAGFLQDLAWLASDAASEAMFEGDGSPVPAKLRDWIAQGCGILGEMTAEETAELMAGLNGTAGVKTAAARLEALEAVGRELETVQKAAGVPTVADVVAKFSAVTAERDEAVAKVAALETTTKEQSDLIEKMNADAKAIRDTMMEKGYLRVVDKAGDAPTQKVSTPDVDPTSPAAPSTLIKAAHAGGGRMVLPTGAFAPHADAQP